MSAIYKGDPLKILRGLAPYIKASDEHNGEDPWKL